jgi:sialate O-acetylesterase
MRIALLSVALFCANTCIAQLSLPSFFDDNMVLQQQAVNKFWGKAPAGTPIQVMFKQKSYQAFANDKGEWRVFLEPASAGNAGNIIITTPAEKKEIKNVLVGEVWICSGQSNMEWKMSWLKDTYQHELQTASNENIHFVVVNKTIASTEKWDVTLEKKWSAVSPATLPDCSAVAYFFAKNLQAKLKVPVGLIITSWGGTPAQAWVGYEGLHSFTNYSEVYAKKIKPINFDELQNMRQQLATQFLKDIETKQGLLKEYIQPSYNDAGWPQMMLPKKWESQGLLNLDGVVVYRLSFNADEADDAKPATLYMPAIDDADSTYINGKLVGNMQSWNEPRKYTVPAGIIKKGKNSIVIKVVDNQGGGGLEADENGFYVLVNNKKIMLAGNARYNIVAEIKNVSGVTTDVPLEHQPAVLYNAMIAPFVNYNIKGAIWYQGESNADKAYEYRSLFPALINDWRNRWAIGNFPFLFVQLASFNPVKNEPGESSWAELREAQTMALGLPNTGMAVTTDIGDPANIHPTQKKEVGDRLAANAIKIVYGNTTATASGPLFKNYTIEGNKIRIRFTNTGSGLLVKGNSLKQFAIAAADKKFVWANTQVVNNEIIVYSNKVATPVAVRYAWADSPVDANLYNKEGFPASPFRTDSWKGITQ